MKTHPLLSLCLLLLCLALPCVGHAAETTTEATAPLTCLYYSVNLPDDWKAVTAPETDSTTGITRAHFANKAGTTTVVFIVGASAGLDGKSIAQTYAQQYKATKEPVENNGQYAFSFQQQKLNCQGYITTQDDVFMFTAIMGNQRDGMSFVRRNVSSTEFAKLLPR